MTVPTLILIGELDDWTPAKECRNLVEGRDDCGISRQKGQGVPIELIVYPGAYHGFDVPESRDAREVSRASPRIQPVGTGPIDRRAAEISVCDDRRKRETTVTIKAVVFDAYGTLYDVQSVADVTEDAFPGYGEIITQIWRIKQLEYTWLRSLMRRYQDFSDSDARLAGLHAAHASGWNMTSDTFARIMDKYLHLDLYPDALAALVGDEGPQARDPLQRQPRHARCAGAQQRARPRARCDHQRRREEDLQAQSRRPTR